MAGFTSTLTEAALSKMQFLHAALTETLRLHPAIPEDPKICFCDDTLPGCLDIKEGDMICCLPYSMGRMKFLWGDRGRRGLPAGKIWLDENGAFQAENPFKFTAFQAGPRICLGKDFAYIQMKIVSAVLLHFFRFELKDESRNVRYKSSITLRIDGGLELLACHRQSVDTVGCLGRNICVLRTQAER